jgi:putative ABC transport system permease protein
MIKNYFKTAWRNITKGKMYAFINIGGLAIGMTVALMIGLWIYDEVSFNKKFENYDRIAQVQQNQVNNGEVVTWDNTPYPLADVLRKSYGSSFKHVVMSSGLQADYILAFNDKKLKQQGAFFEDEAPEMFGLHMLSGNSESLKDPSSILISASASKAYFGDESPLNKIMKIDNMPPITVAGVYEDFPRNSTFAGLNFMAPWNFYYNNTEWIRTINDKWRPNFVKLFVQLNPNESFASVSAKIKDAKLRNINVDLQKKKPVLFLQPMSKWHLYSEFKNGVNVGGAIQYVWLFGIIGMFVLLLACINFMNLSTASSEKRAKEVGIRKTIGSLRKQLIVQFFAESFLTVSFAFILSLIIAWLSLPFFNDVAVKQMHMPWSNFFFWLICLLFILVTAFVAGSYPAFYLSSFKPVKVLKGTFKAGRYAAIPRRVLVVLQFTVSVTLIIGTIIVYRQIQFAKSRPVGYTRANLISIPISNSSIHDHFDAVKNELVQTGAISSIAEAGTPLTSMWNSTSGLSWAGKDPNQPVDFGVVYASTDYGKTINWQVKEGRDFSREFGTDSSSLILNEAAVHFMGLTNPVGQTLTWFDQSFKVVGVIKNMIMASPYDEPKPVIFNALTGQGDVVIIKINPQVSANDALAKVETVFKKFNTTQPFEFKFVDDEYAAKFSNEERVGKLANVFALLAVVISCLGLFGLTSFVAEQRKKEIGVRKVLGASVFSVWNLLSKDFVVLVIISFLVAVPLSYYFMHQWLQNYVYHTQLPWWIFVLAGIGSLLITVLVVSFQAIKAAIANPVKSLRTE